MAADGEQHVVEVMSDAAGQASDRFHLLGLQQLALERSTGADVDDRGEDEWARAGLKRGETDLDREFVAVSPPPNQIHA